MTPIAEAVAIRLANRTGNPVQPDGLFGCRAGVSSK
jgi:hypothetical protein